MATHFQQGYYKLKNPDKYRGNPNSVRYMSSWEKSMHQFLDNNPNIIEWASEEIKIPYIKPTDGKLHNYLPDYYIKYKNKRGQILQEIIEVKPDGQTRASKSKNSKTKVYENLTYAINLAKWQSAAKFCKKRNIKFRILTEKHIFK